MNRYSMPARMAVLCVGLLTMGGIAGAHAQATLPPPDVTVSLQNTTVMAGEPIIVDYKITNAHETALSLTDPQLDPFKDQEWWITFKLQDEEGKPAPSVNGDRPRPPVDFAFGNYSLAHLQEKKGRVAAG